MDQGADATLVQRSLRRVGRDAPFVIAVGSGVASVLVVAFAELAGNTRSNQISVAVLSLPFWVVTALCVRRLADARLPFAYAGAALCVAGAMLVISDPALKDDGLGSIDYIGIPLLLVGITSVLIAGSGSSHPDPEIDAPRADH